MKIGELSLLVYAARGSKKDLIKGMCNYTGCNESDYTEYELVKLLQHTIQEISRKYHIKNLFYNYCNMRNMEMSYCQLYDKQYKESDVLLGTLLDIKPDVFEEDEYKQIKELRKEYINVEKNNG